jgi:hypothetical protein
MTCIKTFSMYESKHFLIAIILTKSFKDHFHQMESMKTLSKMILRNESTCLN